MHATMSYNLHQIFLQEVEKNNITETLWNTGKNEVVKNKDVNVIDCKDDKEMWICVKIVSLHNSINEEDLVKLSAVHDDSIADDDKSE